MSKWVASPSIPERIFGAVGSPLAPPPPEPYAWVSSAASNKGYLHQVGEGYLTSVVVNGASWDYEP